MPIEMEYNPAKRRWEFVCHRPDGMAAATYITADLLEKMGQAELFYLLIKIGWTWREEYDKAEKPEG